MDVCVLHLFSDVGWHKSDTWVWPLQKTPQEMCWHILCCECLEVTSHLWLTIMWFISVENKPSVFCVCPGCSQPQSELTCAGVWRAAPLCRGWAEAESEPGPSCRRLSGCSLGLLQGDKHKQINTHTFIFFRHHCNWCLSWIMSDCLWVHVTGRFFSFL